MNIATLSLSVNGEVMPVSVSCDGLTVRLRRLLVVVDRLEQEVEDLVVEDPAEHAERDDGDAPT